MFLLNGKEMDDDEPPTLVEAGNEPQDDVAMSANMADVSLKRVPITIITGNSTMSRFLYQQVIATSGSPFPLVFT